jgi:hypothetical protein
LEGTLPEKALCPTTLGAAGPDELSEPDEGDTPDDGFACAFADTAASDKRATRIKNVIADRRITKHPPGAVQIPLADGLLDDV